MGKALALGGGGVTGIVWEFGMLAGLAEAGADLSTADLIVGTSAGSVVGAQGASGIPPEELYAGQLTQRANEIAARIRTRTLLAYLWAQGSAHRARASRLSLRSWRPRR